MELGSEAVKSLLRFFTKGHGQKVGMDVGKWSRENHSGNCPNFSYLMAELGNYYKIFLWTFFFGCVYFPRNLGSVWKEKKYLFDFLF